MEENSTLTFYVQCKGRYAFQLSVDVTLLKPFEFYKDKPIEGCVIKAVDAVNQLDKNGLSTKTLVVNEILFEEVKIGSVKMDILRIHLDKSMITRELYLQTMLSKIRHFSEEAWRMVLSGPVDRPEEE